MKDALPPSRTKSRWFMPVLGIGISALFVGLILSRLSVAQIAEALGSASWGTLVLALVAIALGYSTRITRWWCMLRIAAPHVPWSKSASVFLIATAANNVLPLRAGDVGRLFAFRDQPALGPSRVAGTLIIERLLDLFVLLAIFAGVLPLLPDTGNLSALKTPVAWVALAAGIAVLGVFSLPLFDGVLRRLEQRAAGHDAVLRLLEAFGKLSQMIALLGNPRTLLVLLALSGVAWAFEGGVYWAAAHALDLPGGLTVAMFALAVATLSTLLPSSPGYVGTFHFFCMQAALVFGASEARAAAFAVLAHMLLWLPTTLAGAIAAALTATNRHPAGAAASGDPLISSSKCGDTLDAR